MHTQLEPHIFFCDFASVHSQNAIEVHTLSVIFRRSNVIGHLNEKPGEACCLVTSWQIKQDENKCGVESKCLVVGHRNSQDEIQRDAGASEGGRNSHIHSPEGQQKV